MPKTVSRRRFYSMNLMHVAIEVAMLIAIVILAEMYGDAILADIPDPVSQGELVDRLGLDRAGLTKAEFTASKNDFLAMLQRSLEPDIDSVWRSDDGNVVAFEFYYDSPWAGVALVKRHS